MTCENCGNGMVTIDESDGPTNGGRFCEEYSCNVCGAKGYVAGESSAPAQEWDRFGRAFEGSA